MTSKPSNTSVSDAQGVGTEAVYAEALDYLAYDTGWYGQQRFAEDSDADFLLRVLRAVRDRARAALSKASPVQRLEEKES
jgi:hypothetical protein